MTTEFGDRPRAFAPRTSAVFAQDVHPAAAGAFPDNDENGGLRPTNGQSLWCRALERARVPIAQIHALAARAATNDVALPVEATVSGGLSEERLYGALADEIGIGFLARIDPRRLILGEGQAAMLLGRAPGTFMVRYEQADGVVLWLLAPAFDDIGSLGRRIEASSDLRGRVRIVAPGVLRAALETQAKGTLLRDAVDRLFTLFPEQSAKIVTSGWQSALAGAVLVGLPVALFLDPWVAGFSIHLLFSLFFLACVGLRFIATVSAEAPRLARLARYDPAEMPVYSVLVALYHEAEIVPDLLVALGHIVWPRGKLEIKLVCEADDEETLTALRAHALQPFVEIVEVPPGTPRTKPKALSYALPMTTGGFVVLYDAEDRPHPFQLVEAWQRFRESDERVACLQAPLAVTNFRRGPLARMFAFEYAALFRGLLPWLARRNLVIPLGGTSTHFRRDALEAVGGWDPFNVTEDADLGIRLARHGYRVDTITRPTYEDAPENFANWLPQRTRWFKGWMQTWLVHMRRPRQLWRDLGPASFLTTQIVCAGMVVSSIAHPVFLGSLGYVCLVFARHETIGPLQSAILIVDGVNITLGYVTFLLLGVRTLLLKEKTSLWITILLTPVYWILISLAAWRALWKLYREPYHWEKTHHPRRARDASARTTGRADAPPAFSRSAGIPPLRR
jgi:cellulose synthase/poly-beta-1,6-N-acetylglucosamine synthase-like glycosyltransferase